LNWIQNKNFLREFPPDGRYLIGVSGGRDSVALLRWLVDLGYKKLVVCHLNHQLRGRASDADARFVAKLAASYGVDLATESANVRALATKKKMSIETAARTARYSFFAKVARHRKCRTIFLAHHADDLVETFLINLFRGAGTTGLSGMREISKRPIDDVAEPASGGQPLQSRPSIGSASTGRRGWAIQPVQRTGCPPGASRITLTIVRPFLGVWRVEIDKYIHSHRLKFREDASNKNLAPLRNRIRHRVVPYLEKTLGRNIRQNIWRTATIASEEENFFETLLPEKLSNLTALSVQPLRKMPIAVQRRMLHKWLRAGEIADVGFDLIERVRGLLDVTSRIAKTNLPQDRHVRRRAGQIFME
jgi:tRNA(Ile)-lysidine synthase